MKKVPVKFSSNRSFGFLFFVVFFVISLWPLKSQGDLSSTGRKSRIVELNNRGGGYEGSSQQRTKLKIQWRKLLSLLVFLDLYKSILSLSKLTQHIESFLL